MPEVRVAIRCWNQMGGRIDWTALPILSSMHGVDDPEWLVEALTILQSEL